MIYRNVMFLLSMRILKIHIINHFKFLFHFFLHAPEVFNDSYSTRKWISDIADKDFNWILLLKTDLLVFFNASVNCILS